MVSITITNPAPIVLNAQAPANTSGVELTWNDTGNAAITGYYICYGTASGSYSSSQYCGDVNDFIVHGLNSGQTYYFVVAPADAYGDVGAYSQEVSCVAAAPSPIQIQAQATSVAIEAVNISWTASADSDISGYAVYYGTQKGNYQNYVAFYGVNDGVVSGLAPGTYYFAVAPIDSFGIEAIASTNVPFTITALAPTVLQAKRPVDSSGVELTWNDIQNDGVVGYNIYYGTQSQNYIQSLNCGEVNDFIVHGLNPGQTYYFVVAPVDAFGNQGGYSDEASSVAAGPVPVQMQVQGTTTALEAVNVSWTASTDSDVDGYAVDYWVQGSGYTNSVQVYGETNAIHMLSPGLGGGANFYFAIAPIGSMGVEAIASSEASYTVPIPKRPSSLHGQAVTNTPESRSSPGMPSRMKASPATLFITGTQSGSYGNSQNYDSTVTNAVIQGLNGGQTYYFAVNAVDQYGNQSPYSSEVSGQDRAARPHGAPGATLTLTATASLTPWKLAPPRPCSAAGKWILHPICKTGRLMRTVRVPATVTATMYMSGCPWTPRSPPLYFRAINY